jgi:preprotein translocase subunit SecA
MEEAIDREILEALSSVEVRDGRIDVSPMGIAGPSATWTYLVSDHPFHQELGTQLMGMCGTTFATSAAVVALPLFLLLGLVDRFLLPRKHGRN